MRSSADHLRVLHDPIGSQAVYYHARAPLALASHVELLALAVGARKSPEIAAYMEDPAYRAQRVRYLPGDRTIYQDILALPPNMLFDSTLMATRRYWPLRPRTTTDIREFQDVALASMEALARYLSERYVPLLGMTGGVDSRAALAAFTAAGVRLETVTWNPSRLEPGEAEIIDRLVRDLGLHHEYLPFPEHAGQIGRLAGFNSGGMFQRNSKLCTALRKRYRDRNVALIRGWGGEVVRVYYNHKISPMHSFDPKEMARVFLAGRQGVNKAAISATYRKQTEGFFAEFADRGVYAEIAPLGYDPNDIFYLEHRMGMWMAAANAEIDTALRCLVAYNSRRLFTQAFGLPLQQRSNKRVLLDIAVRCDPAYGHAPLTRVEATPFAASCATFCGSSGTEYERQSGGSGRAGFSACQVPRMAPQVTS